MTTMTHTAPGELMRYESIHVLLEDRGGSLTDLIPVGRNHTDDMLLLGPVPKDSVEVNYAPSTGDLIADGTGNGKAALLGSVGKDGLSIAEVFDWLHTADGRLCGHTLSWLIGRMSALSHEPAVCDSLEEFGAWRQIGLGAATTTLGKRCQADVYADIQSDTSGGVSVYFVHQTGDIYAHDHLTCQAALLGQIDPDRREELVDWIGEEADSQPLTLFVAKIEVFNNLGLDAEKRPTPTCWENQQHWWASDLSGRYMPVGYLPGTDSPVVREVCFRCGTPRRTSMMGTRIDGLDRAVLPAAVLMGPKVVITGGLGAEMIPKPRETFIRLTEMFPHRAILTLDDEDVSDLTCGRCNLWVGDPGNPEIAHVSTNHKQGSDWTCEAEAPGGVVYDSQV